MRCVNLEPFCFFCPGEKIWNLNCGIRPQRDARLRCSASFTNDARTDTVSHRDFFFTRVQFHVLPR